MDIDGMVWIGCVDMVAVFQWDRMECKHGFSGEVGWGGHGKGVGWRAIDVGVGMEWHVDMDMDWGMEMGMASCRVWVVDMGGSELRWGCEYRCWVGGVATGSGG